MREVKFRGKRLDNGKWAVGDLIHRNNGDVAIRTYLNVWGDNSDDVDAYGEEFIVDPDTVGQYTGLKDKNGKEIWEGDIMHIPETEFNADIIGQVLHEDDAYYIIPLRGGHLWGLHWSIRKHNAEILGNIHDNPELLKGGEQ